MSRVVPHVKWLSIIISSTCVLWGWASPMDMQMCLIDNIVGDVFGVGLMFTGPWTMWVLMGARSMESMGTNRAPVQRGHLNVHDCALSEAHSHGQPWPWRLKNNYTCDVHNTARWQACIQAKVERPHQHSRMFIFAKTTGRRARLFSRSKHLVTVWVT